MHFRNSLISLLVLLMFPSSAMAHSKAKTNVPETGSVVAAGIDELRINFSKKVRVTKFEMHKVKHVTSDKLPNASVSEVTDVLLSEPISKAFTKQLKISFEPLSTGDYKYSWIAIARDGHKLKGKGHFGVSD
ncbi:MAG: copper resistance CopC family protein [Alphaproteobacteria bacterium]